MQFAAIMRVNRLTSDAKRALYMESVVYPARIFVL